MCGIAGFLIADEDFGKIDTRALTISLGYEMKSRGTDSTGIATVDRKNRWRVRKQPLPADVFLAMKQGIGRNAQTALIHTRYGTKGTAKNPDNNHPIVYGDIIGIHNGMVGNDNALYKHFGWERLAQVDSEAIFAALNHLDLDEALSQIDGSWAIAWLDTANPRELWLARGQSSPLHYAQTKNGSLVFASTSIAVKEAFEWANITGEPHIEMAPEGFLAHIGPDGVLVVEPSFDPSGKTAIGYEPPRPKVYTTYATTVLGADYDDDYYNAVGKVDKDSPRPYTNFTVSGDPKHPKVGDRRKYVTAAGVWNTEICSSTTPLKWTLMVPAKPELQLVPEPTRPKADPLDEWEYNASRNGLAHVGDGITVSKHYIDGGINGSLYGEVTDEDDKQILVNWRPCWIDKFALYEIVTTTKRGA